MHYNSPDRSLIPLYNVSEITYLIKSQLEEQFSLVRVKGEISTFRKAASGHCYFNLKDRDSIINAVLFRYQMEQLDFVPDEGQSVIILGRISVYSQRGNYQLICETMEKVGKGDLLIMLEERKKKLAAQGLFDQERKKPLPAYPSRIGVVTSAEGAAVQDIIQVLQRRMNGFTLFIYDSLVQGDKAPAAICGGIETFNRLENVDVIILARGGGSVEDLLAFSEESVVQAVASSRIPLITGIGHEIDFSLSDFASDARAPTPSAAAEILSQSAVEVNQKISEMKYSLTQTMQHRLEKYRWAVDEKGSKSLMQHYKNVTDPLRIHLDSMRSLLRETTERNINNYRHKIELNKSSIQTQSPQKILKKGFSLVLKDDRIVAKSKDLKAGDLVTLTMQDGSKEALIQGEKR